MSLLFYISFYFEPRVWWLLEIYQILVKLHKIGYSIRFLNLWCNHWFFICICHCTNLVASTKILLTVLINIRHYVGSHFKGTSSAVLSDNINLVPTITVWKVSVFGDFLVQDYWLIKIWCQNLFASHINWYIFQK